MRQLTLEQYGQELVKKVGSIQNVISTSFLPQRNRSRILLSVSFRCGHSITKAYQYPYFIYREQMEELDSTYNQVLTIASHYAALERGRVVNSNSGVR